MYSTIYFIWTHGYLLIFYTLSYDAILCYLLLLLHLFQLWPFVICVLWIYCHHCFTFCILSCLWHFRMLWSHFAVSPRRNWKIVLEIRYGHRVYNQFFFFKLHFICMGWIIFCWTLLEKWLLILSPSEGAWDICVLSFCVCTSFMFFSWYSIIISGYSWRSLLPFSILKRARKYVIILCRH